MDKGIKPDEIVRCINLNLESNDKTDNYDFSEDSEEEVEKLEKEVAVLKNEIEELKEMSIISIWEKELGELLTEWNSHKTMIEEDYLNDLKGETVSAKKPKRTYQKKQ